jgi:rare lipoprotein A
MESRSSKFVATLIAISLVLAAPSAAAKTTTCEASWYGPGFQGNLMANGDRFDMNDPTVVAHKSYPFGTILRVTNLNNRKSINVVVQDRGPFVSGRCVDLSRAAARAIGVYTGPSSGTAPVKVEVVSANSK